MSRSLRAGSWGADWFSQAAGEGSLLTTPIAQWADRVPSMDARYAGTWELPAIAEVAAPEAVLVRPDGYVAWVGDGTQRGLEDALRTWFGAPAAA